MEYNLTFSQALEAVKKGSKIQRAGWNGKGMTVELVKAGAIPNLTAFLLLHAADGTNAPWLASQTDILSEDYMIVE